METKTLKPYFVVLGLMILTSLALAFTVDVNVTDQAGIRMFLPDHVGTWSGREMRFCQNELCQREYHVDELKDVNVCPACGGPLGSMSFGEKLILPADTQILKKHYSNPNGRTIFVSIVLSGKERASIHRPQICLVGQGNEIIHSAVLDVPMNNRKTLGVMLLDMLRRGKTAEGKAYEAPTYYAYWFVGKGRETPYHVQRMIWMGTDRVFHNVSHRWAYIAVAGMRDPEGTAYQDEIRGFLKDLYPEILINKG
ncbi:MAG TPA: exosortase-associated EpsI family protein [Kiritimatiellia bacterium]|mgnify:CR=1 FL=1|nr:exosortase-associated EpsI family protein [Kiritimatiellia bacterium]